jgi:hypothetical protein
MSLSCELIDDVGDEVVQLLEQSFWAFGPFGHHTLSYSRRSNAVANSLRRQELARAPIINSRLDQDDFREHIASVALLGADVFASFSSVRMVSNNSSSLICARRSLLISLRQGKAAGRSDILS